MLKKEKGVRKEVVGFGWFIPTSEEVLKTWELYYRIQQRYKIHLA
jgi:hypothetical protein